jgi:NTP pyrophosphatase (non-canonical NTP hydrolase)
MTNSELERLALIVEEAAEVQQVAMKIVRHGYGSHNPFDEDKTPNRRLLEKELGDLLFAVQLMIDCHDLNENAIKQFSEEKRNKIQQYLHHNTAVSVGG